MPKIIVSMMGRLSRRYNSFRVIKKTVRRGRRERKREIQREVRWLRMKGIPPLNTLSQVSAPNVRKERGTEAAERWLRHQHRVYCSGTSPVEGDPSKRARAHCHTQTWARYRRLVEKYQ
jgi:hypothetical protein